MYGLLLGGFHSFNWRAHHGTPDDDGLVLPPRIAPHQVVIIPFLSKNIEETNTMIAKSK